MYTNFFLTFFLNFYIYICLNAFRYFKNAGTTHISKDKQIAKQQEKARDQLLVHVRERVSLLCGKHALNDLWISKMCQGLSSHGRLNRNGFKAGLRHLGCRGFGPGTLNLFSKLINLFIVHYTKCNYRKNNFYWCISLLTSSL
jgi:hypothetical protein